MMRRKHFRSVFVQNFSLLVTGTAVAQAIPVLLQPLLRRVFDADLFALLAVYNSISSIVIMLSTLRYEMAIVLPERDREAIHVTWLALSINLVVSLLFFLLITLMPIQWTRWLSWPEQGLTWLYLLPLGVLLFSTSQVFNYWLIRKKRFRASAVNRVSRRVAEGAVQAGGGLAGWSGALMWGEMSGRLVYALVAAKQAVRFGFSGDDVSIKKIRSMAVRYKEFPIYQTIPALLNTLSLMLPLLMVNSFYSAETTAGFDLCRQVLALPLALITTAMSQLLLQKFTEQRHAKQSIMPGFLKLSLYNLLFGAVAVLFFKMAGKPLFAFLFGQQWESAGGYAAILAPAFMIMFVVSPLSTLIIALEKVKIGAVWQVLMFLAILVLTRFGHLTELKFFKLFTWIVIASYLIYWLFLLLIVANYEKKLLLSRK